MPNFSDYINLITGVGGTIKGVMDKLDNIGGGEYDQEIRDLLIAINQKAGAIREAIERPGQTLEIYGEGTVPFTLLNYLRQQLGTYVPPTQSHTITNNVHVMSVIAEDMAAKLGPYPSPEDPMGGNYLMDSISRLTATNSGINLLRTRLDTINQHAGAISANTQTMRENDIAYYASNLALLQDLLDCSCEDVPPDPDIPVMPDCEDCPDYDLAEGFRENSGVWDYHEVTLDDGLHHWYHKLPGIGWLSRDTTASGVPVWREGGEDTYEMCFLFDNFKPGTGEWPINRMVLYEYTSLSDNSPTQIRVLSSGEESGCATVTLSGLGYYSIQAFSTTGIESNEEWTGPVIWMYLTGSIS